MSKSSSINPKYGIDDGDNSHLFQYNASCVFDGQNMINL